LNEDVPLGPNLNGAIGVWPELIWSVGIYPNFSNLWKKFMKKFLASPKFE